MIFINSIKRFDFLMCQDCVFCDIETEYFYYSDELGTSTWPCHGSGRYSPFTLRPDSAPVRPYAFCGLDGQIRAGLFQLFRFSSLDIIPRHAPNSPSSTCCFHQKDKWIKHWNLQNKRFLEKEIIGE
jgi:hypothetical protein